MLAIAPVRQVEVFACGNLAMVRVYVDEFALCRSFVLVAQKWFPSMGSPSSIFSHVSSYR